MRRPARVCTRCTATLRQFVACISTGTSTFDEFEESRPLSENIVSNRVVSGSRDATLRVWDLETGECLHVLVGHVAAVRCVQYDGRLVVSGAYDYTVKVWDPERQECLHTLQGHTNRVYSLQVTFFFLTR